MVGTKTSGMGSSLVKRFDHLWEDDLCVTYSGQHSHTTLKVAVLVLWDEASTGVALSVSCNEIQ